MAFCDPTGSGVRRLFGFKYRVHVGGHTARVVHERHRGSADD
jgi:hypothetical protein